MKMNFWKFFLVIICNLFFFIAASKATYAARFSFDPLTLTVKNDTSFDIRILIDTGGESTSNSEALISFNSDMLEVIKVTDGDFYPENLKKIDSDKLRLGGTVTDPLDSRTGNGVLATISFQGKKLGTTQVSFDCIPGKKMESNITKNDTEGTDIINCSQLVAASYTISQENPNEPTPTPVITAAPTATPTPIATATPTILPTLTPTPASIPESGYTLPTTAIIAAGATAIAVSLILLL